MPTDQPNLDLKFYDPPQLIQGAAKHSKASERAKRQRNLPIDDAGYYQSFVMGQVILNPVRAQFMSTSIKVELELKEPQNDHDLILLKGENIDKDSFNRRMPNDRNKTIFIEIPIIGSIVNHTTLFSPIEFTELERSNSSAPLPLHVFDLK